MSLLILVPSLWSNRATVPSVPIKLEAVLDYGHLAATVMFVVGAVCAFPSNPIDRGTGAVLFLVGQFILIVVNFFDIEEALNSKGQRFDFAMHAIFVTGVIFFFIGTFMVRFNRTFFFLDASLGPRRPGRAPGDPRGSFPPRRLLHPRPRHLPQRRPHRRRKAQRVKNNDFLVAKVDVPRPSQRGSASRHHRHCSGPRF